MPSKTQTFFVGDIVEAIEGTALLEIGTKAEILSVTADVYYPDANSDGYAYEINFIDERNDEWTLDYDSSYFKLVQRAIK